MKLLLLSLVVLGAGCRPLPSYNNVVQTPAGIATYNVVAIDGCQYLQFTTADFTHKGNCTNELHAR